MDEPDPEKLFESLIVRGTEFNPVAFDGLIANHPAHAEALRRLRAEYESAKKGLHGASAAGNTPATASGVSFFGRRRREAPELPVVVSAGQELAGFRLIELIGQGGMGQVWRAEQVIIQRQVALKLVRPEMVTKQTLDLFAREARAGARFRHPGIVDIIDHGTSEGIAWIAMEFVEGTWTLRDFLNDVARQDELPPHYYRDVARFVARLGDAMEAVHAQGVIHRDLKPQNILIAPDDTPKITDFGLARISDESALSNTGDFAGTDHYMSPEQVAARRMGIDHRTDVFSLGIVLYEMLSGRRPFEGDTKHQIATQIVTKDPPHLRVLRSRIPRDLAVITGKCLEKDPDRRYGTMEELAVDIRRHLDHEPIHAKPPNRVRKAWLWAERNPTKSVAGGVGTIALAAISALSLNLARANRTLTTQKTDLAQLNGTLVETNTSLEAETRRANEERDRAESQAAAVLRLSALQDHENLMADADKLWPAHPEKIQGIEAWIGKAQKLVDELPRHRSKLKELRMLAIPQTKDDRAAERAAHPYLARLESVEGRLVAKRRSLERRRGGADAQLPSLSVEELALDASAANALAWPLVMPGRELWGDEARGLALALRGLTLAEESEDTALQATIGDTAARAFAALGRDKEARAASALALERAAESAKEEFSGYLEDVTKETQASASAEGLGAAEAELGSLELERSTLAARVDERRSWRFPETEEGASARWWHTNLSKLIASLEGLEDPRTGLLSSDTVAVSPEHGWSMRRRLTFARRLLDEAREGAEHARLWQEAIAAIRGSDKYGDLELVAQVGLVPIGPDPQSGLWEFWHKATGTEPVRGDDRRLVLTEEMGVVLVLIPGGQFWMGATAEPGAAHNFDEQATSTEGPVHEVELTAYFLSKYELTQGQWTRFVGRNPSNYQPPSTSTPRLPHPVEQVSWREAMAVLPRMGLSLPSEAQWENGCRAGTSWPWWTGPDRESLTTMQAGLLSGRSSGFLLHAPVGTFAANPFGLHDVHGNVSEWCLDAFVWRFYQDSPRKDPVARLDHAANRVYRGGSFSNTAATARSSTRLPSTPSYADLILGVRPARAIEY